MVLFSYICILRHFEGGRFLPGSATADNTKYNIKLRPGVQIQTLVQLEKMSLEHVFVQIITKVSLQREMCENLAK